MHLSFPCIATFRLIAGGYRTAKHIPVATVQGGHPARRSKHCNTRRKRATYGTSDTRGRFCEGLLRPSEGQVGGAATDSRCKSSERGTSGICRRKRRQQTAVLAAIPYDRLKRYGMSFFKISTFLEWSEYLSFRSFGYVFFFVFFSSCILRWRVDNEHKRYVIVPLTCMLERFLAVLKPVLLAHNVATRQQIRDLPPLVLEM